MSRQNHFGDSISASHPPIIFVRRKAIVRLPVRNETWRLAYADFITALMALFSVLWVLSNKGHAMQSAAHYFHPPELSSVDRTLSQMSPRIGLGQLAEQLQLAIQLDPRLTGVRTQVEMKITIDGLTINLLGNSRIPFFGMGSGNPTKTGKALLQRIAEQLGKVPNRVVIEGHTDSKPYSGSEAYTNWELSIDRANAARRVMMSSGLRSNQVAEIIGSADTKPGISQNTRDFANRRVTIIVKDLPATQTPN